MVEEGSGFGIVFPEDLVFVGWSGGYLCGGIMGFVVGGG